MGGGSVGRIKIIGQAMYEGRNNEGRSRNRCCGGKAISITYSECVFAALVIQHATRMRRIVFVVCGLSGPVIFLYIISIHVTIFREKLLNTKCVF